jgi:hypothetical protein
MVVVVVVGVANGTHGVCNQFHGHGVVARRRFAAFVAGRLQTCANGTGLGGGVGLIKVKRSALLKSVASRS